MRLSIGRQESSFGYMNPRRAMSHGSRRWLLVGEVALALLLVTSLVVIADIDGETLRQVASSLSGWPTAAVIVLTAAQVYLSACKWSYVLRLSDQHVRRPLRFYLRHTAAGMLLGQVLPTQVGTAAMRAAALRASGEQRPLVTGTYTSLIEQSFDVLVPLALVPASLFTLHGAHGVETWLALGALSVLAGGVLLVVLAHLTSRRASVPRGLRRLTARPTLAPLVDALGRLITRRALLTLWTLSALRFAIVLLRTALVAQALGFAHHLGPVVMVAPLVQCMALAAITPGALGIVEWGWAGLLSGWQHWPAGQVVGFALAMRASFAGALALLALFTRLGSRSRRDGGNSVVAP